MLENQKFCKPKNPSLWNTDPAAQIVEKKKVRSPFIWNYNQVLMEKCIKHILPLVFLLSRISEQDRNSRSS